MINGRVLKRLCRTFSTMTTKYFNTVKDAKHYDQRFSVSVCLPAILNHTTYVQSSPDFLCLLSMSVARSCSDDNATSYIGLLSVL